MDESAKEERRDQNHLHLNQKQLQYVHRCFITRRTSNNYLMNKTLSNYPVVYKTAQISLGFYNKRLLLLLNTSSTCDLLFEVKKINPRTCRMDRTDDMRHNP